LKSTSTISLNKILTALLHPLLQLLVQHIFVCQTVWQLYSSVPHWLVKPLHLDPREPRVTAAGRRDGEHTAGLRIDLLDPILDDLKQLLASTSNTNSRSWSLAPLDPTLAFTRLDEIN
jgi:hypothetical protein